VSAEELAQLEADVKAAEWRMLDARWRVRRALDGISELRVRLKGLTAEEQELQVLHDQLDSHRLSAHRSRHWKKAAQKKRRRDAIGNKKAIVRNERRAIEAHIERINAQAESLKRELRLAHLERTHAQRRHLWLRALAGVEDADGRAAKLLYMRIAKLGALASEAVWVYTVGGPQNVTEVHLFYGGGISPLGAASSPDGAGHGHHILRRNKDGKLSLDYKRLPSR
jgi:hypothetical protein